VIAEALNSYALSLDYLRSLIDDIPEEALAGQKVGAVNHPLWTIGHLVHSAQMIGGEFGVPPWLPESWAKQYGTGSVPVSDRSAYPNKEVLLNHLKDAHQRIEGQLTSLGDSAMGQPFPDVRYREMFPTLGHGVSHVLMAHTAAHIGQVIVWRRVMGFPPCSKVYD
jgi:hypothetical protein